VIRTTPSVPAALAAAQPSRWLRTTVLALGALGATATLSTAARAETLAERLAVCSGCHGEDGNSPVPDYPKLSGLDKDYIVKQLNDFKAGRRTSMIMTSMLEPIDPKEFAGLAKHFAEQKRSPTKPEDDKALPDGKIIYDDGIVASAVPACAGCHNDDGSGTDKYPRLARQHPAYIATQLKAFKSGERANDARDAMKAVAKRMSDKEIEAVSQYIATLSGGEEEAAEGEKK
jgi:cytochrome c553